MIPAVKLGENAPVHDQANPDSFTDVICAALRADPAPSPALTDAAELVEAARVHGVECLLYASEPVKHWPKAIREALRRGAVSSAAWELRHQQLLRETLAKLAQAGIAPILIKGTPLAYTAYSDPCLRSRGDTDLIVLPADRTRVDALLQKVGFRRAPGPAGEFVSYQASYTLTCDGNTHALDLHWKINNSELLSRLFDYDELRATAVPLVRLSEHAVGTCLVNAFLIACMHRATHRQNAYSVNGRARFETDRLIWLYDIHLLAERLSDVEWDQCLTAAARKGLLAVCGEAVASAGARFGTRYPQRARDAMAAVSDSELPFRYLNASKRRQQLLDFVALGSVGKQLRYMQEVAFPPAAYMRQKYPERASQSVGLLYMRRGIEGVLKQVRAGREPR